MDTCDVTNRARTDRRLVLAGVLFVLGGIFVAFGALLLLIGGVAGQRDDLQSGARGKLFVAGLVFTAIGIAIAAVALRIRRRT